MIEFKKLKLSDITPENLMRDEVVRNITEVISNRLLNLNVYAYKLNYTTSANDLPEEVIDHLLWEAHLYKPAEGLALAKTREEKINLLEAAVDLHRHKGTPFAIERVLQAVDLEGDVLEWKEYDAEPYHFIVELKLTKKIGHIDDVRELVMHYKNTRSWFDGFVMMFGEEHILHLDATYDYPVYYKYCNEVVGCAGFFMFAEDTGHLDAAYDYHVPYEVMHEASVVTENELVENADAQYAYHVGYSVCGEMEPNDAELQNESTLHSKKDDSYNYLTPLLVCGEFECGEELV